MSVLLKRKIESDQVPSIIQKLKLDNEKPDVLIPYIQINFHDKHRAQLPALIELSRKIEIVHEDDPDCPVGLADVLTNIWQELDSHMQKEERVLFPMLLKGMKEMARTPISVMLLEHEQHEQGIDRLLKVTGNLFLPDSACGSWEKLYSGIGEFVEDLRLHLALENEVLFK
ncbi:hemerythrin domain-containing protein [Advenella sp. WQ 585]|uniref:Hemerythrin domain-containing protein n=1 Tax=Advenella mandrilli TaxID=2800330 RepID=A0ABS1EBS7_9BURK|nr:hemerythrin domain-containing protein [Advenella mandrilli]MBK1780498.1 hemerythrin domain-containing protein [Advenella mandrilli]